MALGSVAGALAGSAAQAGIGLLGSKLLGGKKSGGGGPSVSGFSGGGLTGSFGGGRFNVSSNQNRRDLVGGLAATFPELAGQIGRLRGQVTPGIGALTTARLGQLDDIRRRTVGDVRENLQRRRVLGSSFAQDAIARTESEFARQADTIRAESFLQELDLTNQFIQAEFEARRGEFQTQLDELNLQADIASRLSSGVTQQLGANARLKQKLAAEASAGAGRFFGQSFEPFTNALAGAFSGGGGGVGVPSGGGLVSRPNISASLFG